MEKEPNINNSEKILLTELANELERIQRNKTGAQGDIIMQKLIKCLQAGDAYRAKVFLNNESDKFMQYRDDGIPLIIQKLYSGSGSPWFTIERKLNENRNKS